MPNQSSYSVILSTPEYDLIRLLQVCKKRRAALLMNNTLTDHMQSVLEVDIKNIITAYLEKEEPAYDLGEY